MLTVIITIRKEVVDQTEANVFYDRVKEKAMEVEGVTIAGLTTNHFAQETTPEE